MGLELKRGRFRITAFNSSQYWSVCRVHNAAHGDYPLAIAELKHDDRVIVENGYFLGRFAASELESRRVVGYADASEKIERHQPGTLYVQVVVNPQFSKSGTWEALYDKVEQLAQKKGSTFLRAEVSGRDAITLERWESLGFVERSRSIESRLDLRRIRRKALELELDSTARPDIAFTTLAKEKLRNSRYVRDIYDMENSAGQDVPITDRWRRMNVSEYVDLVHKSPTVVPSAWFLAKHGNVYVGESFLLRNRRWFPASIGTGFTCVRREFRGRGIARHLKLLGIKWAKEHEVGFIRTSNDSDNEPMLTLNRELGFERYTTWLKLEKRLR